MARVLCIDTEPETVADLRAGGHEVFEGSMGFRSGARYQPHPPHEFDAILCDLHKPACYDSAWWGPHKNDNNHCKLVDNPQVGWRVANGRRRPTFPLIQRSQMQSAHVGHFSGQTIVDAILKAGTVGFGIGPTFVHVRVSESLFRLGSA